MDLMSASEIQEAIFIYRAINDGWKVYKGNDGEYKFKKPRSDKKADGKRDFVEKYLLADKKEGGK